MPSNWEPPVPAWSAEIESDCTEVIISYIGYQTKNESQEEPNDFHNWYTKLLKVDNAPIHTERGSVVDNENYRNNFYISYWNSKESYEQWRSTGTYTNWWNADNRLNEKFGYWCETMIVPTERFETLFSTEDKAGATTMFKKFKGPIKEHNYFVFLSYF